MSRFTMMSFSTSPLSFRTALAALMTDAIFNSAPNPSFFGFVCRQFDRWLVVRMNLFVGRSFFQFLGSVAKQLLIGRAVVKTLAVGGHNGDHVRRVFSNQAEEFFLGHKVHSKAVDLMLLIDDINNEEKHHSH